MKKQFFAGCGIGMMLAIINIAAVIYMFQLIAKKYDYDWQSGVTYFATTVDGRIFRQKKRDFTSGAVLSWASQTLYTAFTISPDDYEAVFDRLMRDFSYRGWRSFMESLEKRNMIGVVEKNGYSIKALRAKPPELQSERVIEGIQTWVVNASLTLSYKRGQEEYNELIHFRLVVERDNLGVRQRGLKITDMSLVKG